jgi:hypothetical protein
MSIVATCHCGSTRLVLPDHPTHAARCNCTFCQRTGAVWAYFENGTVRVEKAENQRSYSTQPEMGLHHFCGTCGMHTWGESIEWAKVFDEDGTPKSGGEGEHPRFTRCQVNLNLIDDLDWSRIEIEALDGRNGW